MTPESEICVCVIYCNSCTRSGAEEHVHAGEECPVHREAPVS